MRNIHLRVSIEIILMMIIRVRWCSPVPGQVGPSGFGQYRPPAGDNDRPG